MAILILSLLSGTIFGLFLAILTLKLSKVNCPQCKKLKPVWEITVFNFKERIITVQSCQKCQKPKPQIDIEL